ncbi:hypothetical protein ABIB06_007477 [Bradyrhizobium sp. LB8.2]|uniref:hypothetical protein n=1 Tax=unclassified Bradyrhizobium TaxID=2631580 RepID=UPI003394A48A
MAGSIHDQLVKALSELGARALAEKHAVYVHAVVLAASRGHDIGEDETGYYARPRRAKSPGPAKEFRDLASLARKTIRGKISQQDWAREWAARPPAIWRACRPFLLESGRRSLDRTKLIGFSAPGFTTVIPKPEAVLPALEIARELSKIAIGDKKQRKPDQATDDVISAVQSAYSALTGYQGGRAFLNGGHVPKILRLGHEIDELFGTNFFPQSDSTRLKRVWGQKPAQQK